MTEWLSQSFSPGPLFWWLCAASLVLIPFVWIRAGQHKRRPTFRFSSIVSVGAIGTTFAQRSRFVLPLLRTLALLALIVALARPQSTGAYKDFQEGIAIQMVLDVSGSMATDDFIMNGRRVRRLDAVKKVFHDFVLGESDDGARENDLIGMTSFAMYADTPCPLTLDHASLVNLLDETDIPGWVDGRQVREHREAGYTALGDAIVVATDDLRRAGEQAIAGVPGAESAKSKVMILLTDGQNHPAPLRGVESPDPIEAANVAATLGIKIYTIGAVGSAGSGRNDPRVFFQRRAEVDEPMLKNIAAATGGKYFRATSTDSLATIYEEIDRLERRRTGERSFHDNVAAAKIAMLIALGLLSLELLLVNTRFRRIP